MAYFDCIVGGSGKGNTLVVTCADDLAGATITCTNGTKTYRKTCPSTAPYEVTFYGLAAGTWTVSATVSGDTYTTTVVITDYEAELGGFNWKTWVDLSENYTSSDFTDLDDLLSDETAVRELMTIHACVDYLADIAAASADVEQIIENDYCAKWINNRDYALDTLYANTIIADYMDTADKYFYGEWVITDNTTTPPTWGPKGNVPVMTSNNAPYGSAGGSSANTSYPHYKAFDGDDTSYFETSSNVSAGHIYYGAVNPICVRKFHIINGSSTGGALKIRYSDDAINWTECDEAFTLNANGGGTAITDGEIADYGYHLYWDAYLTPTSSVKMRFKTLQFYGRELSVSVPVMTGNTTPYGEASATLTYSTNNAAWKAFDKSSSTSWIGNSSSPTTGVNLQYEFISPMLIKMATVSYKTDTSATIYEAELAHIEAYDIANETWEDISGEISISQNSMQSKLATVNAPFLTDKLRLFVDRPLRTNNTVAYQYGAIYELQAWGLDYSEKEFEEGTNKKWLYDHGVELETPSLYGGATKKTNCIDVASGSSGGVIYDIDITTMTNNNVVRSKVTEATAGNGYYGDTIVRDSSGNTNLAEAFITQAMLPNTVACPIVSINQAAKIYFANIYNNHVEFNELWLE